jgi:cupin 2 domain-containing protein
MLPYMHRGNLHADIPADLPDELFTKLAGGSSARVERIVSRGHRSPAGHWYDQDEAEFVLLVAGEARLEFEGVETRTLRPGDWVTIPAHARHRVAWTAPDRDTVWLAVFYTEGERAR